MQIGVEALTTSKPYAYFYTFTYFHVFILVTPSRLFGINITIVGIVSKEALVLRRFDAFYSQLEK